MSFGNVGVIGPAAVDIARIGLGPVAVDIDPGGAIGPVAVDIDPGAMVGKGGLLSCDQNCAVCPVPGLARSGLRCGRLRPMLPDEALVADALKWPSKNLLAKGLLALPLSSITGCMDHLRARGREI